MLNYLDIIHVTIDTKFNVVDCNIHSQRLFGLSQHTKPLLRDILQVNLADYISEEMTVNEQKSFILFKNSTTKPNTSNNAILVLYCLVSKHDNGYQLLFVNWLNWLHYITRSLEVSYLFMSEFNNVRTKEEFVKISDAGCYKALFPLITYIPNKSTSGVGQISLFEIMRIFIKQRDNSLYTRDYARNVYSRIRTNLKQDYNLTSIDFIDLLKNPKLLKINFNGHIYLIDTLLIKNIFLKINPDVFLILVIQALHVNNLT